MESISLESSYQYCRNIARNHYENFPVASLALPAYLRNPISAIYAFARYADDLADEGELLAEQRLQRLDALKQELMNTLNSGNTNEPLLFALRDTIMKYKLPTELFYDLIRAFSQDVTKKSYQDEDELLDYCKYSANPVGRLLLILIEENTEENIRDSDLICSALQLINFCQDIQQDYHESGRIYIPLTDLKKYHITKENIMQATTNSNMEKLLLHQVKRARNMLIQGAKLGSRLKGRFGYEIRLTVLSASLVAKKLVSQKPFTRPRLLRRDWAWLMIKALFPKYYLKWL